MKTTQLVLVTFLPGYSTFTFIKAYYMKYIYKFHFINTS